MTFTLCPIAGAVRLVIDNTKSGPTDEVRTEGFAIPPVAGTSVAFPSAPAESASDEISAPHSHPVRAPSHGQVEPQWLFSSPAAGAVSFYDPWKTHREYLP